MLTEVWMQRAFLAALFLAPLCALLGVFVTARRMAFFSDTISGVETSNTRSATSRMRRMLWSRDGAQSTIT